MQLCLNKRCNCARVSYRPSKDKQNSKYAKANLCKNKYNDKRTKTDPCKYKQNGKYIKADKIANMEKQIHTRVCIEIY